MSKISIYLLLILFYLGVSKSLSPTRNHTIFVKDKYALSNLFPGRPLTIILLDVKEVGLFMKTYLQKFLIIEGFEDSTEVTVRTPKVFFEEEKKYVGLSILRRGEQSEETSFTPMPPGVLFMGDPSYGYWKTASSGKKKWYYYRAYKNLPKLFAYGDYRPTYQMLKSARIAIKKDIPFFGLNNEFGPQGTITKKNLKSKFFKEATKTMQLKDIILRKLEAHRKTNE